MGLGGRRLSEQLAGLPRLMPPLVAALKGPPPLVQLALRILEYWIDSLNPEFLEPAMAGVATQLLSALIAHLKPEPYPFGAKALQLLGKLGGRNRRFLKVGCQHLAAAWVDPPGMRGHSIISRRGGFMSAPVLQAHS